MAEERFFIILVGDDPKTTTLADFGTDIAKATTALDEMIAKGGPEGVHRAIFTSTHGKYKHKAIESVSEHAAAIAAMGQASDANRLEILQRRRNELANKVTGPATELSALDTQLAALGVSVTPVVTLGGAMQELEPSESEIELTTLRERLVSLGLDPDTDLEAQLGAKVTEATTEAVAQHKAAVAVKEGDKVEGSDDANPPADSAPGAPAGEPKAKAGTKAKAGAADSQANLPGV